MPEGRVWLAVALLGGGLIGAGPAWAADAPDAQGKGKDVYEIRCAPCHGANGAGDGPAAAALNPRPRNFRDADFWKGRTVQQLRLVVKQGRPGTLMTPFEGVLSDAEIDAVVAYVQAFRPPAP
jgi:mono/diheme cytochrome c family protein